MGDFRTKLDYSDNRQIKQRTRTSTTLSGTSVFGVPFSAMTSGPDENTTFVTQTVNNVNSTFSGNSGTTVWTFGDTRMSIASSALSAVTPSNSGVTQNTDDVFVAETSTTIDSNLVNLTYTGVSFDISITGMTDLGGGNYSGSSLSEDLEILSAGTLDYTGRTIWVDVPEILRTKKIIVSENPVVGYILTSDSEGMGTWQSVSGATSGVTFWEAGAGTNATILEGTTNTATGNYSVAIGNGGNATGAWSFTQGLNNTATGATAFAGGSNSTANGAGAFGFGDTVTASGQDSFAVNDSTIASNVRAFASGKNTTASGSDSSVFGRSGVASGIRSQATGYFSVASGTTSIANGGYGIAGGVYSFVNGSYNYSYTDYSSILGGSFNQITGGVSGRWSIIGGGNQNYINAPWGFIGGGQGNNNYGYYGTIGGGRYNIVSSGGRAATVIGGENNTISGTTEHCLIGGGELNKINGVGNAGKSLIVGGESNYILTSTYSSILAGRNNMVSGTSNTHIIGSNITGTTANTTYVENINVKNQINRQIFNIVSTSGATVIDLDNGVYQTLTLSGSVTLNQTTLHSTDTSTPWSLEVIMSGGTGTTLTLGTNILTPGGNGISVSTNSGATDTLLFETDSNGKSRLIDHRQNYL